MTDSTNVSLVPCVDYNNENVRRALIEALTPIGGLDWVKPGMKIGVKLNLCSARSPESAATTHPVMAAELTRLLVEKGAEVILGDSPGGPYTEGFMNHVYQATGISSCESAGGRLNHDYTYSTASFREGKSLREFSYVNWLRNCDAVVNFSKLKAHGLMGLTAAVKNLYGIIPGTIKTEYHYTHTDPLDFADMLVDLNEFIHPELNICDGVTIMEGNGPTQGTPRHLGVIIASKNPYCLDRMCAALTGVNEEEIPYLVAAKRRGLLSSSDDGLTSAAAPYRLNNFTRSGATVSWFFYSTEDTPLKRLTKNTLSMLMRSRPKLMDGCVGCGQCANMCPAKAIVIKNKRAVIDRKKCVRCFCCQEFCPTGAMQVHRTAIARLLQK